MKETNFEFPILSINKNEYENVKRWISEYRAKISEKKLYIFGAGIRGNMFLKLLEEEHISVTGFGDNSTEKQGGYIKNYPILSMDDICSDLDNNVILVSTENYYEIDRMLAEKGCQKNLHYFIIENDIYPSFYKEFFRGGEIKYIVFGDCFFTELDIDDLSGLTMGEMIKAAGGVDGTKVLSIHGMCIPSFYYLMREQLNLGIRPKAVGFIVNIPFCNGIQTKLPQSQHSVLLKQIEEGLPQYSETFSNYVRLAEERSKNINAKSFSTNRVRNNDNIERILTKTRYMYELNEENENIEFLKRLVQLLLENNIKPVPFIPALNYFSGIEWFGEAFNVKYNRICQQIKEKLQKMGVSILDMSLLLDKSYFTGDRMTKFPSEEGKRKEIDLLRNALEV